MNIPKYDKYCGSVDEEYSLWNQCNICAKTIVHRKGRPFTMIYWREKKLGNGYHLKQLELEEAQQHLEDKAIFIGKKSLLSLKKETY